MIQFELVSLALDGLQVCLLVWFWRHRVSLAQKVMDMPMPGVAKDDYRVISKDPNKLYYKGPSLSEAKRIRNRERRNGVAAVLTVNGQARN